MRRRTCGRKGTVFPEHSFHTLKDQLRRQRTTLQHLEVYDNEGNDERADPLGNFYKFTDLQLTFS
jgi:hypothetical protein